MSARPQHLSAGLWYLIAAIALLPASGTSVQSQETQTQENSQELCVTCEEPFAVYRCVFDDHSAIRVSAQGAPLACAKELAQRGGHARCSIRRNSSGPCGGELVVITPPADTPLAPPPGLASDAGLGKEAAPVGPEAGPVVSIPGAAPGSAPAAASGEPVAPPIVAPGAAAEDEGPESEKPLDPPKTVEELAKRTAKSSKEGLKDAGEAVAGAAKKTGETIGEAGSAIGKAAKSTWRCLSTLFSDC